MTLGETWAHGWAECFCCGTSWAAAWPLGAEALECPACGSTDTDRGQEPPAETTQPAPTKGH